MIGRFYRFDINSVEIFYYYMLKDGTVVLQGSFNTFVNAFQLGCHRRTMTNGTRQVKNVAGQNSLSIVSRRILLLPLMKFHLADNCLLC